MMRTILGVMAGLAVAVLTVFLLEGLGHWIFPPPPGTDLADRAALETLIAKLPVGAIIAVLVAWAAGVLLGSLTALRISRKTWTAYAIATALFAAGVYTMVIIPHPTWFMLASLPATVLPAWAAVRLAPPTAE